MKKATIGLHDIEVYESIEELPIGRWHKFQKYSLIEGGIGSDLSGIDAHISRVAAFIRQGENDKAVTEIENLRTNVHFVQSEVSPKLLSAACLIANIDGVPQDDISEEGLQRVIDTLSDVPMNIFTALFQAVKKKMEQEVATYFPSLYGAGAGEKEYSDLLRQRTLAVLEGITGERDDKKIAALTDELLTKNTPMRFSGEKNAEIGYDRQYERMCVILAQNTGIDPKRCNVMEFYNAYEVVKEQNKQLKNHGRHR